MSAAPPRLPLNESLKTMLRSYTNVPVAVASPPLDDNGKQEAYPYIVIYPIMGGAYTGAPFCGNTQDADWHYQITTYGERDDQVELIADRVREAVIGRDQYHQFLVDLPYDPGKVTMRSPVGPSGRLVREGQIYKSHEDYSIEVTTS